MSETARLQGGLMTTTTSPLYTTWNEQSAYDTALDARQRLKLSVFPLDAGKQPPILPGKFHENGDPMRLGWKKYQSKLAHEKQLDAWQRQYAPTAWAIITGALSGRIILDFDKGAGGLATLEQLGLNPHVRTGSGGYHVHFLHPGWRVKTLNHEADKELGQRWPGLDIRADGGYAAFCGSSASGHYIWLRDPGEPDSLDVLPDNLRDFLGLLHAPEVAPPRHDYRISSPVPRRSGRGLAEIILDKYVQEARTGMGRDNACFSMALQLRDNDYSESEACMYAREFAGSVPNTNTKGQHEPFTESEAIAKVKSAYSQGARQPWEDKRADNANGSNGSTPPAAAPTTDKPHSYNRTDFGNAERLVARFGADLRYCHAMNNWLVWKGTHWQEDKDGHAERLAKKTVRLIYQEAAGTLDDAERKAIAQHALRSESKKVIRDMLILAQSEEKIPIKREDLDANTWLLNCANGTVDLKTGALRKHQREDKITKCLAVKYVKDAQCPQWLAFLNKIFDGKQELVTFIQRALGYALTGDTSEQCFFLLYGTGQNGKSTLLEVIQAILAEYSQSAEFRTFLSKDNEGIRNDIARMNGKRLVVAKESDKGKRLAEALIKQLTGEDTITARFLHQEYFDFKPQFKLFLAANHKPEIQGTDLGIWRRVRLIPFTVTIPEDQKDKHLPKKLLQEAEGILAWLIQGCLDWQHNGLGEPAIVKDATKSYRDEMDVIASFLEVCCIQQKNAEVGATQLYTAYKKWCEDTGERWEKQKTFGERLTERGYTREKTRTVMVYKGLGLLTKDESVDDVDDVDDKSGFFKKNSAREKKPESSSTSSTSSTDVRKFYDDFCSREGYHLWLEADEIHIEVPADLSQEDFDRLKAQVYAQGDALLQVLKGEV